MQRFLDDVNPLRSQLEVGLRFEERCVWLLVQLSRLSKDFVRDTDGGLMSSKDKDYDKLRRIELVYIIAKGGMQFKSIAFSISTIRIFKDVDINSNLSGT